jgi:hypothetical protein
MRGSDVSDTLDLPIVTAKMHTTQDPMTADRKPQPRNGQVGKELVRAPHHLNNITPRVSLSSSLLLLSFFLSHHIGSQLYFEYQLLKHQ